MGGGVQPLLVHTVHPAQAHIKEQRIGFSAMLRQQLFEFTFRAITAFTTIGSIV